MHGSLQPHPKYLYPRIVYINSSYQRSTWKRWRLLRCQAFHQWRSSQGRTHKSPLCKTRNWKLYRGLVGWSPTKSGDDPQQPAQYVNERFPGYGMRYKREGMCWWSFCQQCCRPGLRFCSAILFFCTHNERCWRFISHAASPLSA